MDDKGNLKTSSGEFNCSIELKKSDDTALSETSLEIDSVQGYIAYSNSVSGVCIFKDVRIMRSGTYIFYFSSNSTAISPNKTTSFTTTSTIISIVFSSVESLNLLSAYFIYDFKVAILVYCRY